MQLNPKYHTNKHAEAKAHRWNRAMVRYQAERRKRIAARLWQQDLARDLDDLVPDPWASWLDAFARKLGRIW